MGSHSHSDFCHCYVTYAYVTVSSLLRVLVLKPSINLTQKGRMCYARLMSHHEVQTNSKKLQKSSPSRISRTLQCDVQCNSLATRKGWKIFQSSVEPPWSRQTSAHEIQPEMVESSITRPNRVTFAEHRAAAFTLSQPELFPNTQTHA